MTTPLLTPKETAHILKVAVETLSNWRSSKTHPLPFVKLGGHTVRYKPKDLERFINRGKTLGDIEIGTTMVQYNMIEDAWYEEHWQKGKCVKRIKQPEMGE